MNKLLKLVLCLVMFSGCTVTENSQADVGHSPFEVELYQNLDQAKLFDSPMIELTNDQIKGYYQHPSFDTLVTKAQVYSTSDTSVNEVALFEAKDEFEAVIYSRIDELKRSALLYFPTEVDKIDNYVLIKKEAYFILVIGNDAKMALKLIEELIK